MNDNSITLFGDEIVTKKEKKKAEKEFVDSIMSIFRPKVVMPMYSDAPIPEKIQQGIFIDRLILAKEGLELASETETMWYISTASLEAPLDSDWSQIYFCLCRKWALRQKKDLPDFLEKEIVLNDYQEQRLLRLRTWIYEKGMKVVL